MKKQVQVYYSGNVHGVGFRYTAENLSNKYPITGYVRNNPGGNVGTSHATSVASCDVRTFMNAASVVEIVAEGEEEDLKDYLSAVKSSMKDYIQKISENWMVYTGKFEDFRIIYY